MNITVTWGKKPTDLVQVTDKLSNNDNSIFEEQGFC
jgi:hypothetical protein